MNNNFDNKGVVRSPVIVLLLGIVTCGIYYLYWLYITATELKAYTNRGDINPGLDLVLCILCFPYQIYWFYKYSKIIYEEQMKLTSVATDNSIINVILSIFGLGIVSAIIMQSDLNNLWTNQRTY
ncbi:MAG: DUF4234 domain-containing protein [Oscillospiraceae bacterium]|nr:DUF4234 domain-containing protein [Oscillospiraceae bacterium]